MPFDSNYFVNSYGWNKESWDKECPRHENGSRIHLVSVFNTQVVAFFIAHD